MKLNGLMILLAATSLCANTWSFEGKSQEQKNKCEQVMSQFLEEQLNLYLNNHEAEGVLDAILGDIKKAVDAGTLNSINQYQFIEVNANLKVLLLYAQKANSQDMIDKINSVELQFPGLLADVCQLAIIR